MIDPADVARVRETADLVEIAGEHVQLKRSGRQWMAICPFHEERSPSLSVNGEEGVWYCFGCQEGGDTIDWVRRIHHLDFVEAIEWLAARTGLTLTRTTSSVQRTRRSTLTGLTSQAARWYHAQLLTSSDATEARDYLADRGFAGEVLEEFQLGWAPAGWDELIKHLGAGEADTTAAGLARTNRAGRLQDVFRSRIVFPIRDVAGDVIGFGGRLLPGADGPKYINSSDGPLYRKRQALYGLHKAKAAIVKAGAAVVCEGYLDVIGSHIAGVTTAVASCGTALGGDHLGLLGRFTDRVILAFDADTAGANAASRLHDLEAEHGVAIDVAALPAGTDPADLAIAQPAQLQTAVADAVPLLRFLIDRTISESRTDGIEARVRTAEQALALIAEHPSRLVQDEYLMSVASRLSLDSDLLRDRLDEVRRQRPGRHGTTPPPPAATTAPVPELEVTAVGIAAQSETAPWWLRPTLFSDDTVRTVIAALAGGHRSLPDVLDELEDAGRALALRATSTAVDVNDGDEVGVRLVRATIERHVGQLGDSPEDLAAVTRLRQQLQRLSMPNRDDRVAAARAGMALVGEA